MARLVQCPSGCEFEISERSAERRIRCPYCQIVFDNQALVVPETFQLHVQSIAAGEATPPIPAVTPPAIAVPIIEISQHRQIAVQADHDRWLKRFEQSRAGRVIACRVMAFGLGLIAMAQLAPLGMLRSEMDTMLDVSPWSRWMFVQAFVAMLYTAYAVYLFQINDWSSLRAISVVALAAAILFAASAGALNFVGARGSLWAGWLQLGQPLVRTAVLWCLAMICVNAVIGYVCARESSRWLRAETLLAELGGNR